MKSSCSRRRKLLTSIVRSVDRARRMPYTNILGWVWGGVQAGAGVPAGQRKTRTRAQGPAGGCLTQKTAEGGYSHNTRRSTVHGGHPSLPPGVSNALRCIHRVPNPPSGTPRHLHTFRALCSSLQCACSSSACWAVHIEHSAALAAAACRSPAAAWDSTSCWRCCSAIACNKVGGGGRMGRRARAPCGYSLFGCSMGSSTWPTGI